MVSFIALFLSSGDNSPLRHMVPRSNFGRIAQAAERNDDDLPVLRLLEGRRKSVSGSIR
jgi:hypothetical protein